MASASRWLRLGHWSQTSHAESKSGVDFERSRKSRPHSVSLFSRKDFKTDINTSHQQNVQSETNWPMHHYAYQRDSTLAECGRRGWLTKSEMCRCFFEHDRTCCSISPNRSNCIQVDGWERRVNWLPRLLPYEAGREIFIRRSLVAVDVL